MLIKTETKEITLCLKLFELPISIHLCRNREAKGEEGGDEAPKLEVQINCLNYPLGYIYVGIGRLRGRRVEMKPQNSRYK